MPNTTGWSDIWYFTTAGHTIDRVIPSIGYWQRLHEGSSTFLCYMTYRAVEGALTYRIETYSGIGVVDDGLRDHQAGKVIQQGLCYGLTTIQEVTDSYWRVQACTDTQGQTCGPWSEYRGMGNEPVTAPPLFTLQKPHLVSPAPGEAVSFPLTLRWNASPRATDYNVTIYDADPTLFPGPPVASTNTTELEWTLPQDPAPSVSTLYWRAQACISDEEGAQDCSDWTGARRFVTEAMLAAPTLVSPVGEVAQQPIPVRLIWDPVVNPNADFYEVDLARDGGFTDLVVDSAATELTEAVVGLLEPDTAYFWRVRAWRDDGENSLWSEGGHFRTDVIPSVVSGPVSPADGATEVVVGEPVVFVWPASAGASFYRWRLSEGSAVDPSSLVGQADMLQMAGHEQGGLQADTVYAWQVQACTGAGCSPWSQPGWVFATETLATPTALARYYYLKDHLGSVRATVDASGAVVHHDDYYPFGAPMPNRSMETPEAPRERFTGHEREWEIDPDGKAVYYAGARYYDAVIGRWNAVDPLAEHPNQIDKSPYQYAWNNPILLNDPDGRCPSCLRYFVRTVKGAWKQTSRRAAVRAQSNSKNVRVTGRGASREAKRVWKEAHSDKKSKIARHDGHELPNGKAGLPHYQHKNGGIGHVFYKALGGLIPFLIDISPAYANELGGGVGNEGEDLDRDGVDDSIDEVIDLSPRDENGVLLPPEEMQEEEFDDPENESDPGQEEEGQNQ